MDEDDVGVLVAVMDQLQLGRLWKLWLLGVWNGAAGAVEAGSLEERTVKQG